MNDRYFDFLYKIEQQEIETKLRQKELLNRKSTVMESDHSPFKDGLRRIWQRITSMTEREWHRRVLKS